MSKRYLSPEITSLIHHVELTKSGWWKKAVGQIIKGVLWKLNRPAMLTQISEQLEAEVGMKMLPEVLDTQIKALMASGEVVRIGGECFKLSESTYAALSEAHKAAQAEQEECKAAFMSATSQFCPTLHPEVTWQKFSKALASAIGVIGANTFHLLAAGNLEKESNWLQPLLGGLNDAEKSGFRQVVSLFFSPDNKGCRAQILRLMSAHFFVEASQLTQETIKSIDAKRKKRTIRVILDTNFIISALALDDNPGSEAALSLLDLIKGRKSSNVEIKLNVLSQTIDETTRTLSAHLRTIEKIRYSTVVYGAAASANLPSIVSKYFSVAYRANGISPEAYLKPYIDDLKTILKDKGIDVLEAHPSIYNQRPDVVDDLNDELAEDARLPANRQKGHTTVLHDIILWHAANDRRQTPNESPLDVETWAVSLDWRLIRFDQRKRRETPSRPPVVLFPTNLLQLLHFWVPRSDELESSVVDSLRLPLFFNKFDGEDEQATIKILEVISRYENVNDLSEAAIGNILANQALRGRIKDSDDDNAKVTALIREEFIAENKRTTELLSRTQTALQDASSVITEVREKAAEEEARRTEAERTLDEERELTRTAVSDLQEELAVSAANVQVLTSAVNGAARREFALFYVLLPAALALGLASLIASAFGVLWPSAPIYLRWVSISVAVTAELSCAVVLANRKISCSEALESWWLSRSVAFAHKHIVRGVLLAAIGTIYQGGLYDGAKALLEVVAK